jgi:hypothetical protein
MADVGEILKFREYKEQYAKDDFHYDAIAEQLRDAVRRGHDVQLHIHSSYFNARPVAGGWEQDWSEYNFAGLTPDRMDRMVRTGKNFLEELLRPVDPAYECSVFRAANWSVSPSVNVIQCLNRNGIRIDTSVFKYGRRNGIVTFDYTAAHSDLVPWPVHHEDICRRDPHGTLVEMPIYCEQRWVGAFFSANRIRRALMGRAHRIRNTHLAPSASRPRSASWAARLTRRLGPLVRRHAWKADFNQCTGRQLIRALERAHSRYGTRKENLPFILIGHSKLFSRANERSLAPFLRHVAQGASSYGFGLFKDVETAQPVPAERPGALIPGIEDHAAVRSEVGQGRRSGVCQ